MKILFVLFIILFAFKTHASNHINNYVCELLLNDNSKKSPLRDSAPEIMQISYQSSSNELVDLLWDGKSVVKSFVAVKFSSKSKILELWRKDFEYSQKDNILFELYASDLVGHLYMLYKPGLDYQCSKL